MEKTRGRRRPFADRLDHGGAASRVLATNPRTDEGAVVETGRRPTFSALTGAMASMASAQALERRPPG